MILIVVLILKIDIVTIEMLCLIAVMLVLSVYGAVTVIKEKAVLDSEKITRYYGFGKPKTLRYEEIDYVNIRYAYSDDIAYYYDFYYNGRVHFRIPSSYTNINDVLKQLRNHSVLIQNSVHRSLKKL